MSVKILLKATARDKVEILKGNNLDITHKYLQCEDILLTTPNKPELIIKNRDLATVLKEEPRSHKLQIQSQYIARDEKLLEKCRCIIEFPEMLSSGNKRTKKVKKQKHVQNDTK